MPRKPDVARDLREAAVVAERAATRLERAARTAREAALDIGAAMPASEELTAAEVAHELGVTRMTVVRMLDDGRLRGRRENVPSGWRWLVPRGEVDRVKAPKAGP